MKKITLILSTILLVVGITACSRESVEFDADKLTSLARTQVTDMIGGNFKSTADNFNSDVAKQLDENGMKVAWDSVVAEIGEHIGEHSISSEVNGDTFVVKVIEEFEHNGLIVTIVYDVENMISGINLNYKPIEKEPVTTDGFEEIAVTIGDEFPLDGILTLPKGVENPPVVLLVHGSGASDKNETIYANAPFKDIAHALAEHGIATLRYDKRFYTYTELATQLGADLSLEEEVLEDVDFALELLANDTRVDNGRIYVLGHSLGGGLTPYIASQNDDIKGIISMAGTLKPLYEISYDQNKMIEKSASNGEYDEVTSKTIEKQMEQVEKDILILRGDLTDIPNDQILLGIPAGYQKSAKEFAGENYIEDIAIPILILQGDADFQVSADTDFKLWEETLTDRENATFKLYENLNHLMMKTNGKSDVSEYQIKGTVSEDVINDIVDFIVTQ